MNELLENTTDKDSSSSKDWKMNLPNFIEIIKLSVPISESEKNYLYDIRLKSFEGNLHYRNDQLLVKINGGGWLYISNIINDSDYILLGCNVSECEKYFIIRGNQQEE